MKGLKDNKGSLEELFYLIYDKEPELTSHNSIACEKFKSIMDLVNFNTDLYDALHGKDGWYYNLLTGKLEKKY
jgi:hypothetical protein